eukprot:3736021-Rhodomonas_salina.2
MVLRAAQGPREIRHGRCWCVRVCGVEVEAATDVDGVGCLAQRSRRMMDLRSTSWSQRASSRSRA